jgi:putative MFS transporter
VPLQPWGFDGWRWVVLLGSVGAIFVWFIRQRIPESPRWLISQSKLDEAERVTREMERRVSEEIGAPLPSPKVETTVEEHGNFFEIFGSSYGPRTIMLMVFNFFQTIGYYGFASWVPTLLIANGVGITSSLQFSFIIAISSPFGPLFALSVADKFERKWQIVVTAILIAGFGLLFARQRNPVWLIVFGVMLTCANNWMSASFHTYQAELFPTRIRARAVGFVYSWSRLSAVFTSLMIGFFLRDFGVPGVFTFIGASMLVVVLSIGIFGPRTRNLALEVISH